MEINTSFGLNEFFRENFKENSILAKPAKVVQIRENLVNCLLLNDDKKITLENIPILQNSLCYMPTKIGDCGLIIPITCGLDNFSENGNIANQTSYLSYAFIHLATLKSLPKEKTKNSTILKSLSGTSILTLDTLTSLESSGVSLAGVLSELIDIVSGAILVTPTGAGSIDPATKSLLTALKIKLESGFK